MKLVRTVAALVGLVICLLVVPRRTAADESYFLIGSGNESCGAWTQDRRDKVSNAQESWVAGFISGVNVVYAVRSPGAGNLGQKTDFYGLMAWIDSYCQAHPLDVLASASIYLVGELGKDR